MARRWLMLCPKRKDALGRAKEPAVTELNFIRLDADKTAEIRGRLSDISWWMRLLCQRIAQRANREGGAEGKLFLDGATGDDEEVFAIGFGKATVAFGNVGRNGEGGTVELVDQESVAAGALFGSGTDLIGEFDCSLIEEKLLGSESLLLYFLFSTLYFGFQPKSAYVDLNPILAASV